VAASNPPLITFESRESQLQIRGNLKLEFAGKSPPKPKFPANPVAEIPAISIADQSLRDISRSTKSKTGLLRRFTPRSDADDYQADSF
jgi:hypothetical protein